MSKAKNKTLTVFSRTLLGFPNICARCGMETDQKVAVKIGAGEPGLKPTMLLGHIGHIIEGIKELSTGSTRVPCCPSCRRFFVRGRWVCFGFLICGPAILCLVAKYADAWPDWLMILAGFIAFVMILGALIPYTIGERKSVPVTIWQKNNGYYYQFHSGFYREWAAHWGIHYAKRSDHTEKI